MQPPTPKADAADRKRLGFLLRELCVDLGFCTRLTADALLCGGQALGAREFANAVLLAEGMDPELEPAWRRRIEERFCARFGSRFSIPARRDDPREPCAPAA
ncbi:hypothetical protein SSBR45G_57290 [Bradyrhizobium sp. SSBR45G]|uniref:hypothetical protein n=1 Tax=unclassified Bradyrhizobium TaxID=2631580 RepID=UPI002342A5B1|nr:MULTISPECIES: hypothetical protein [unclassified Bradyrhizobium]GLH80820.1 hypothetical protein SSBR45G_57290 [Bradyrhizobium sp. SSBR45G]GLH88141.1 hypothetical protein SSBR45R_56020 [Bradyrhizobium sp. SSBR45R]